MTKKELLKDWMARKGIFSTHEVVEFGLYCYCLTADRYKRLFQEEGLIRKLTPKEKEKLKYKSKDAVYKWIGEEKQASVEYKEQEERLFAI